MKLITNFTGDELKAARQAARLSLAELGYLSGRSKATIHNLEACGSEFVGGRLDTRQKVAQVLAINGYPLRSERNGKAETRVAQNS